MHLLCVLFCFLATIRCSSISVFRTFLGVDVRGGELYGLEFLYMCPPDILILSQHEIWALTRNGFKQRMATRHSCKGRDYHNICLGQIPTALDPEFSTMQLDSVQCLNWTSCVKLAKSPFKDPLEPRCDSVKFNFRFLNCTWLTDGYVSTVWCVSDGWPVTNPAKGSWGCFPRDVYKRYNCKCINAWKSQTNNLTSETSWGATFCSGQNKRKKKTFACI